MLDIIFQIIIHTSIYYDDKKITEVIAENNKKYLRFHDKVELNRASLFFPLLFLPLLIPIVIFELNIFIKLLLISIILIPIILYINLKSHKIVAYQRFCKLYVLSQDIKNDFTELNKTIPEYLSLMSADNTNHKQEFITSELLKKEDKIWEWIKNNKHTFDNKTNKKLNKIYSNHKYIIKCYLKEALAFYHNYHKNISNGCYEKDLIPPMFLNDDDIKYFESFKNNSNY